MGKMHFGVKKPFRQAQFFDSSQFKSDEIVQPEPVERVIEVIKEVEVPVYIDRPFEVVKEVMVEVKVPVIEERIVLKDVIKEIIKEVRVEVPVERIVEVEKIIKIPVLEIRTRIPYWARWTALLVILETAALIILAGK